MSTQLFQLEQSCLRLLSHNMEDFETKVITAKHLAMFGLIASAIFPMTAYALANFDQVETFTAVFTFAFTDMLSTVKISTFLYHKRNFMNIMKSFRQLHQGLDQRSQEGIQFVKEANKLSSMLAKVYCACLGGTTAIIMVRPILKMIYCKLMGVPHTLEQAMPMKFPFDAMNSPGYEVVFVLSGYASTLVVFYLSAIEGLFVAFALNLRAHFQTLQHKIETLAFDQEESKVDREIADVAKYHIRLLNLCKDVNSVYSPIIFVQFLITSIQVAVIIYQIMTHMNAIMALLVYLSFLSSITIQLGIYCYGGEIIKNESMQTSIAVQLSDWDMAIPRHRRSLVFIMHRAQQEMKIEAGFYEASLESYLKIYQAAMSFIALFQSVE